MDTRLAFQGECRPSQVEAMDDRAVDLGVSQLVDQDQAATARSSAVS